MEQTPRLADLTLTEFQNRLASAEPVPGGGSASAIAGSMAASLLAMVSRLSADRPKYAMYSATHERALATGDAARTELLQLADDDATAYAAYAAARKMPRETEDEQRARDEATRLSARQASEAPLAVARACAQIMLAVEAMAGRSNVNASSDLEVAGRLAAAAARGAAANVLINLPSVGDEKYATDATYELQKMLQGVDRLASQISQRVAAGALRDPEA